MQRWPDLGFGVGFRAQHTRQFLQKKPVVDWLEVHAENYFGAGGFDLHVLQQLRCDYPISLHGVGLGIGSAHGFSQDHLHRLAHLVERVEPALVSEHLCWASVHDKNLNDLLPLSLTSAALSLICERVQQLQDLLRRPILLENLATHLRYRQDDWSETGFLAEVVKRTGCGVLLDVNNLYVNQCNHQEDALAAMHALPIDCVGEIHLAGHLVTEQVVIDHHGAAVDAAVWELYRAAIARFGRVSSLIEWDTDIPALPVLLEQAALARQHAEMAELSGMAAMIELGAPAVPINNCAHKLDLATTQQDFSDALFDPLQTQKILPAFSGSEAGRQHRFELYRGNLHAHWDKALANVFPVLKMLVGEEFFSALVIEYGQRCPSQDGDLNLFGAQFAEFLQAFPHVAQYPYFPDMARLEWALHCAHYAADAIAVSAQQVANLTPEQLDASRFVLHPACTLLRSAWAVDALWHVHQTDPVQDFPDPMQVDSHMLVLRTNWKATVLPLSTAAFATLMHLQNGNSLGDALEAALEIDADFQFFEHFKIWLAHEILLPTSATRKPAAP